MNTILIQPVEIIGSCPAKLSLNDTFSILEMNLELPSHKTICFLALSSIPPMVWQLQSGDRFFSHVSCPGCTTDLAHENRVVFLLGHEDKWEYCHLVSQYLRLSKEYGEKEQSAVLKNEAIDLQNQGRFQDAQQLMKQAIASLKQGLEG